MEFDTLFAIYNDPHSFQLLLEDKELFTEIINICSIKNLLESLYCYRVAEINMMVERLSEHEQWKKINLSSDNLLSLYHQFGHDYNRLLMNSSTLQRSSDIYQIYYLLFEHENYMNKYIVSDLPSVIIKRFCEELDAFSIASLFLKYPEYGKKILAQKGHPFMTMLDAVNIKRLADNNENFAVIIRSNSIETAVKSHKSKSGIHFTDKLVLTLFMPKREFYQMEIIKKSSLFPQGRGACAGFVLDAVRAHLDHANDMKYTYAEKTNRAFLEKSDSLLGRSYLHRVLYYQYKYNDPLHRRKRNQVCIDEDVNAFAKEVLSIIQNSKKEYLLLDSGRHLMALIPKYEHGKLVKLLFLDPNVGEINIMSGKKDKMLKALEAHLQPYNPKNDKEMLLKFRAFTLPGDFYQKPRELKRDLSCAAPRVLVK